MGVTRVRSRELGGGARVRPAFSNRNPMAAQAVLPLFTQLEVKPDARRAEVRSLREDLNRHYGVGNAF